MLTPELIRETFVDRLKRHFNLNKPDPDGFVADLVADLLAENFSSEVLDLAVRNIRRTRRQFPSVADCLVACHASLAELRSDAAAEPKEENEAT